MDSCNPTRIARHGLLLTSEGPMKIKQLKFERDYGPIDPNVSPPKSPPHPTRY